MRMIDVAHVLRDYRAEKRSWQKMVSSCKVLTFLSDHTGQRKRGALDGVVRFPTNVYAMHSCEQW